MELTDDKREGYREVVSCSQEAVSQGAVDLEHLPLELRRQLAVSEARMATTMHEVLVDG